MQQHIYIICSQIKTYMEVEICIYIYNKFMLIIVKRRLQRDFPLIAGAIFGARTTWLPHSPATVELWRKFRRCTHRSTTIAAASHNTLLTACTYVCFVYRWREVACVRDSCGWLGWRSVYRIAAHTCAFIYLFLLGALFSAEFYQRSQ